MKQEWQNFYEDYEKVNLHNKAKLINITELYINSINTTSLNQEPCQKH